nr:hypothetical protein [Tanacetum cinerariifolium]
MGWNDPKVVVVIESGRPSYSWSELFAVAVASELRHVLEEFGKSQSIHGLTVNTPRRLTRSGWFGFAYRGGLPGTGQVLISTKEEPIVPIPFPMIDLLKDVIKKKGWGDFKVNPSCYFVRIDKQGKRQAQVPNLESVNEKIRCIEGDYPTVSYKKGYTKAFENISNIVVLGDEQLRLQEIP